MDKEKTITKIHISEVTEKARISVQATLENKKLELPTEYAVLNEKEQEEFTTKFGNKGIPIENIIQMWQNSVREVDFTGSVSKLDLIVVNDQGVFQWENIKIYKFTFSSGRAIHVVLPTLEEGYKYNRRRGVRINIDKVMDVEQDDIMYSVIVRDLSYCGVGFVEPLGSQIDPNREFILHLLEDTDDGEREVGKFFGRIINQKEDENGGVFSGCTISSDHAAFLQRYIATKQIEAIRGKSNQSGIKRIKTGEFWKEDIAEEISKSEEDDIEE
ncbi:hypothetical protein SAMN02910377_01250 [Pseudobutyrivibrio ruminis]|uniref:PilZ domain-containing protein n=1 Tax=Pseudobutyrivibrio ruminis TaxID=46206 RepID=A0A1H7IAC9_9FIRM|nr:PilZ domain-containing protein [Pseudobutyrivibrio ruminis]SEK58792.1 hypothetical protein SAMN02910377_01250 [Pseudobutyrivibrio ruminis]